MNYPLITIVMPVRNEVHFIDRSLRCVLDQDYPGESIEVIVADGMSDDGTRDIIREFQDSYPNLQLINNPGKIVPKALNRAITQSQGEIIIRVDGHCEIPSDYVRRCFEHLRADCVDGVGGAIDTIGETWIAQAIAAAMSSSFGVGNSDFRTTRNKTMFVDSVPFPAYTRAIIERAGPYDEELVRNQDDEYNYRLRKLGAKILLAADIRSKYYSRSSLQSLWRQYFQYGFWKVRVFQKHPRQMRPRQFVPLVLVVSIIISGAMAILSSLGRIGLAGILGTYSLANLGASIWTASRQGWRYLPPLPFIYAILHLSYGLGFLFGLFRFVNRWGDKEGKVPLFPNSTAD